MPANYPAPTEAIQAIYVKTINILLRSYPVKDSPLNIRPVRQLLPVQASPWPSPMLLGTTCPVERQGGDADGQAMVFVTAAWLILLGVLGMAPLPELPLNDKALHFFGVGPPKR